MDLDLLPLGFLKPGASVLSLGACGGGGTYPGRAAPTDFGMGGDPRGGDKGPMGGD